MTTFSVVTPSYQQGPFIEQTIQTVLAQNALSFEHVIIDGGSTDETLSVLKKYPHLKWTSEPDHGRAHAINKGLKIATGDIIAWINSDDYYPLGAFDKVAQWFAEHPEKSVLVGRASVVDRSGNILFEQEMPGQAGYTHEGMIRFWKYPTLPQPAIFFRRSILGEIGFLDERYESYMDYDFFLRLSQKHELSPTPELLAYIRLHHEAGSVQDIASGNLHKQLLNISRHYWGSPTSLRYWGHAFSFLVHWPSLCWQVYYERFAFAVRKELNVHFSHQISRREFLRLWPFFFKYPLAFIVAGCKTVVRLMKRQGSFN